MNAAFVNNPDGSAYVVQVQGGGAAARGSAPVTSSQPAQAAASKPVNNPFLESDAVAMRELQQMQNQYAGLLKEHATADKVSCGSLSLGHLQAAPPPPPRIFHRQASLPPALTAAAIRLRSGICSNV